MLKCYGSTPSHMGYRNHILPSSFSRIYFLPWDPMTGFNHHRTSCTVGHIDLPTDPVLVALPCRQGATYHRSQHDRTQNRGHSGTLCWAHNWRRCHVIIRSSCVSGSFIADIKIENPKHRRLHQIWVTSNVHTLAHKTQREIDGLQVDAGAVSYDWKQVKNTVCRRASALIDIALYPGKRVTSATQPKSGHFSR
jgi:hypothetical protein